MAVIFYSKPQGFFLRKKQRGTSDWNDQMAVKSPHVVKEESATQRFKRARRKKRSRGGGGRAGRKGER